MFFLLSLTLLLYESLDACCSADLGLQNIIWVLVLAVDLLCEWAGHFVSLLGFTFWGVLWLAWVGFVWVWFKLNKKNNEMDSAFWWAVTIKWSYIQSSEFYVSLKSTCSFAVTMLLPRLYVYYLLNILGYVSLERVYSFSKNSLWLFFASKIYLYFSLNSGTDLSQNLLDT